MRARLAGNVLSWINTLHRRPVQADRRVPPVLVREAVAQPLVADAKAADERRVAIDDQDLSMVAGELVGALEERTERPHFAARLGELRTNVFVEIGAAEVVTSCPGVMRTPSVW